MAGYVLLAARGLLTAIFAYAFFTKVRSRDGARNFLTTVRKLTMLPARSATVIAVTFTGCEAATAVLVALPWTSRIGFTLAAGMLVFFIGVVFRAVRGRVFAECGCFGDKSSVMSYPLIVRNVLLLAVATPGVLMAAGQPVSNPASAGGALAVGLLIAAGLVRYYDTVVRVVLIRRYPAVASAPKSR